MNKWFESTWRYIAILVAAAAVVAVVSTTIGAVFGLASGTESMVNAVLFGATWMALMTVRANHRYGRH